jgi:hypothetical protein
VCTVAIVRNLKIEFSQKIINLKSWTSFELTVCTEKHNMEDGNLQFKTVGLSKLTKKNTESLYGHWVKDRLLDQ